MRTSAPPFDSPAVAAAFDAFPPAVRTSLMRVRALVFRTAAAIPGVGKIEETLKWGEPAYLTPDSHSGSTVRLGWKKSRPDEFAVYFNCQTTLVDTFRTLFPQGMRFEGNRALVFHTQEPLPEDDIAFCLAAALTYHLKK